MCVCVYVCVCVLSPEIKCHHPTRLIWRPPALRVFDDARGGDQPHLQLHPRILGVAAAAAAAAARRSLVGTERSAAAGLAGTAVVTDPLPERLLVAEE